MADAIVKVSDLGLALIIAEGQMENAMREVRRWKMREQEATEMKHNAAHCLEKWERVVRGLQQQVGEANAHPI